MISEGSCDTEDWKTVILNCKNISKCYVFNVFLIK